MDAQWVERPPGRDPIGGEGLALDGVGHGTVLAGRYRLEERVSTSPDGSVWRAVDETLDRQVSVRVMRPNHPFAADVTDAARRAALVEDPRLVRVLDVGTDGALSYVICEFVDGETLAALVERSALPAPTVRRIVGEAAEGLARAAARGLHHLRITPRSVVLRADGAVKVIGTAVEAAAAGLEPDHAATASRVDAVALVGLVYAGLTGRWPLGDAGFPAAPRRDGGPVPPADLARDVPNDLDTLCAVTLSRHDDGPRSPAELAQQLAPWPSAADLPAGGRGRSPAASSRAAESASPPPALPPAATPTATSATSAAPPAAAAGAAAEALPIRRPGSTAAGMTRTVPFDPAVNPPASRPQPPAVTPVVTPAAAAAPPAAATAPGPPAATAPPGPPARPPQPGDETVRRREQATAGRGAPAGTAVAGRSGAGGAWSDGWPGGGAPSASGDSTGPFPLVMPTEPPPREQSRLVIAVVAAVVVLGLLFAIYSLRDFGSGGGLFSDEPTFTPSSVTGGGNPAATTPGTAASPTSPAVSSESAQVVGIRALDPEGDGDENTSDSPKAVDGKSGTSWHSDSYRDAQFGGLKDGLGLVLQLSQRTVIHEVELDIAGRGGTVELRAADDATLDGSTKLDTVDIDSGTVTLTPEQPVATEYLIIWFTELPRSDGKYRADVSEVTVR